MGDPLGDRRARVVKRTRPEVSKPGNTPDFDTLGRMNAATTAPSGLADWLMGRGQYFISTREAACVLGVDPGTVWTSLSRARQAGKMVSVTKGGWVPVPPEYRTVGAPPPVHYIDPMMRHLGHSYYVGFLSAAAFYGASHQAPMVLQVVTDARLRNRRVGRSRIQFVRRRAIADRRTRLKNVPTGRVNVSTPETTVLDLVEAPSVGAGLSNVATVIGGLLAGGHVDPAKLAEVAKTYPTTIAQRAGHLIESMAREVSVDIKLEDLSKLVACTNYTPLSPSKPATRRLDKRWRVQANTAIEHDL